jgi:hypothetical protein
VPVIPGPAPESGAPLRLCLTAVLLACVWLVLGAASSATASERNASFVLETVGTNLEAGFEPHAMVAPVVDALAAAPHADLVPVVEIVTPAVHEVIGVVVLPAPVVPDASDADATSAVAVTTVAGAADSSADADAAVLSFLRWTAAPTASAHALHSVQASFPSPEEPLEANNHSATSATPEASSVGVAVAVAEDRLGFTLAVAPGAGGSDEGHPASPSFQPGSVPD